MSTKVQKSWKGVDIQKSVRKRRALMKEKCHLIDHEISLNLQKLDSLLRLIKSKKNQPQTLKNILETQSEEQIDVRSRIEVKKQRRLKFKYSIHRQYAFEQNTSAVISTQDQVHETGDNFFMNESLDLHESILIDGNNIEENFLTEEGGNATDRSFGTICLRKKSSGLKRYSSLRQSRFAGDQNEIQSIQIETRYNWIQKYLNHEFNDTLVKGFSLMGEPIELIKFNKKEDQLQCKIIQENDDFSMSDMTNTNRSWKASKKSNFSSQYLDIKYKDFCKENQFVQIDFPRHTYQVKLLEPEKQEVIRISLLDKEKSMRILLKAQNLSKLYMQRIMIFKEISAQNSSTEKYKIAWTKYDKESFLEDIILEGGYSYLITNLCCNPSAELKLFVTTDDLQSLKICKTQYDPWRSYNILCAAFEECSKVFMSQNVFDEQKPLQYLRANYLDYGLVLQIYQNIHQQKISFTDIKEKKSEEDICLLFSEIYTEQQSQNTYEPDELVIKFYEVTEKPARLYFPEKKILVGNEVSEQVIIYSTFK